MPSDARLKRCATSLLLSAIALLAIAGVHSHRAGARSAPLTAAKTPFGFTPNSFKPERQWEEQLINLVSPQRCRTFLRSLTSEPHVAGTPGDRRISEYIAGEFRRDRLETEIVEYKVLLSYPKHVSVDLIAPVSRRLANPEPPIAGDHDTQLSDTIAQVPWNGYSPSADITGSIIYVNYGRAEDYDRLEHLNISVKNQIVLARYFHGYRGGKSLEAEKRG